MKDAVLQSKLQAFEHFLIRIPSFPANKIDELRNCKDLKLLLRNYFEHSEFNLAVQIASPILHQEANKLFLTGNYDSRDATKVFKSLLKYFIRMATRSTPFGVFAGVSIGSISDNTNLTPETFLEAEGHFRIDAQYSCELGEIVAGDAVLSNYLKYYTNNTLYKIHDQFRYVKSTKMNGYRDYKLSSVQLTTVLKSIIKIATNGKDKPLLIDYLVGLGIARQDATGFVDELISEKILTSELDPKLTGDNMHVEQIRMLSDLLSRSHLDDRQYILEIVEKFRILQQSLDRLNNLSIKLVEQNWIRQLQDDALKIIPNYNGKNVLQVDLRRKFKSVVLDRKIISAVAEGIEIMSRFTVRMKDDEIANFKKAFLERFESQEVPLTIALDPESGIGFPPRPASQNITGQFLDDIIIPDRHFSDEPPNWHNSLHTFWYDTITAANFSKMYEVNLQEVDISRFPPTLDKLPITISVMLSLLDASERLISLNSISGSSALNIQSRFSMVEKGMIPFLKTISDTEAEKFSGAVIAEIIHLPLDRLGNVTLRPVIREYEIPLVSQSSVQPDHQIRIDDIMISVKHNRLVLRSKSLKKEIVPRLSNAHNYTSANLPIYYFLCKMQTQGLQQSLNIDMGLIAGLTDFIPRIRHKNIIISPAIWNLKRADYEHLLELKGAELLQSLTHYRERFHIPRYFICPENDNELLIDSSEDLSAEIFVSILKKAQLTKIMEFLFDTRVAPVRNGADVFTNQIILSFKNISSPDLPIEKDKFEIHEMANSKTRKAIIGDEWAYFKIYVGFATADKILIEDIFPLALKLSQQGAIKKWFFIRFSDPGFHLRIRFQLSDTYLLGQLISSINRRLKKYVISNMISTIQMETYNREIERYGPNTMELAEELFHYDTEMCIEVIKLTNAIPSPYLRWAAAIVSIDSYLNLFAIDLDTKLSVCVEQVDAFSTEFGASKSLTQQFEKKYKDNESDIISLLENAPKDKLAAKVLKSIEKKNRKIKSLVPKIVASGKPIGILRLVVSYIHMDINRLFTSKNRSNEYFAYYFLEKVYKKKKNKTSREILKSNADIKG